MRLDGQSQVQLGWGARKRRPRASINGLTSFLAVEAAGDKDLTKALLAEAGVPVPSGTVVRSAGEAADAARDLGFPVVAKPLNGNDGRSASQCLRGEAERRQAFDIAARHGRRVVVERLPDGRDHGSSSSAARQSPSACPRMSQATAAAPSRRRARDGAGAGIAGHAAGSRRPHADGRRRVPPTAITPHPTAGSRRKRHGEWSSAHETG
jgi:hypothetical protein